MLSTDDAVDCGHGGSQAPMCGRDAVADVRVGVCCCCVLPFCVGVVVVVFCRWRLLLLCFARNACPGRTRPRALARRRAGRARRGPSPTRQATPRALPANTPRVCICTRVCVCVYAGMCVCVSVCASITPFVHALGVCKSDSK